MKTTSPFRRLSPDQWIFFFAIVLLSLGGLGGSLQPSRILSICLLPFMLVNLRSRFQQRSRALDNATVILAVSLVLLAVLSVGWSYAPATSVGYTVVLCINMMPLLYIASLSTERRQQLLRIMVFAWFICMAITLPVAFYELATGNHFLYAIDGRGAGPVVPLIPFASIFFGNFNDYSMFLTLCVTMLMSLTAVGGAARFRFIFTIVMVLTLMVLVFNVSRGALGTVVLILLIRAAATFGTLRLLFLIAIVTLGVVVLFDSEDVPLLGLVIWKFSDVSDDLTNDYGRLAIINACLQGIYDSYGFGLGVDGYGEYFSHYFPNIIPNPHNLFLELALNFGLLGLLIFVLHVLTLLRRLFSLYSARAIQGAAFALTIAPLLLLPLMGVVQSHLTGYTYFWYWYAGYILLSTALFPVAKAEPSLKLKQEPC